MTRVEDPFSLSKYTHFVFFSVVCLHSNHPHVVRGRGGVWPGGWVGLTGWVGGSGQMGLVGWVGGWVWSGGWEGLAGWVGGGYIPKCGQTHT